MMYCTNTTGACVCAGTTTTTTTYYVSCPYAPSTYITPVTDLTKVTPKKPKTENQMRRDELRNLPQNRKKMRF